MLQEQFTNQPGNSIERFRHWHGQYRERLLNSVIGKVRNREIAEDITAAAFEMAWQKFHTFRGESSFYTWVYAIALSQIRNLRRRDRQVSLETMNETRTNELVVAEAVTPMLEHSECC